ncbi:MAG: hypothetical protein Q7S57_02385 [bacterium]|nr:hypothetical protein [bacterium]
MNKNVIKIILIATDTKKRSLVFIDENLKIYSLKHKDPHNSPQPNDRGLQIVNEFYKLAQDWLK